MTHMFRRSSTVRAECYKLAAHWRIQTVQASWGHGVEVDIFVLSYCASILEAAVACDISKRSLRLLVDLWENGTYYIFGTDLDDQILSEKAYAQFYSCARELKAVLKG